MILTIDLGTTATKVGLWSDEGLVAMGRSNLETIHGPGGRAEQDPESWWVSVKRACAEVHERARAGSVDIEAVCFSAARQTFVPVDRECRALGAGILWSDRRAFAEALEISRACDEETLRSLPGVSTGARSVMAKIAWLFRNEPSVMEATRWLLAPRDLVVARMTGVVATDSTLASASGVYDTHGALVEDLARAAKVDTGRLAWILPEVIEPTSLAGPVSALGADELGIAKGTPVAMGAGDRACEVLGAGASALTPMVSWGTTANVSVPLRHLPVSVPRATVLTRSAEGGWLVEGGVSGAGSLLDWVGRLTGIESIELYRLAATCPPGANGVVFMPWLDGARAPWWRDDAHACVMGLRSEHGPGDVARAAIEGVAFDVARCLDVMLSLTGGPDEPDDRLADGDVGRAGSWKGLVLGGGGSGTAPWFETISAVTGVPARRRSSGEAASAGAALLGARAVGTELDLELIDPVAEEIVPGESLVGRYAELRRASDETAALLLAGGDSGIEETQSGRQIT